MSDPIPYIIICGVLGVAGTVEIYRQQKAIKRFEAGLSDLGEKVEAELSTMTVWDRPDRYKQLKQVLGKIRNYSGEPEEFNELVRITRDFV